MIAMANQTQPPDPKQPPLKEPEPPPQNPEAEAKPDGKRVFNVVGTAIFGSSGEAHSKPLKDLAEELPTFPTGLHRFQDPRHAEMCGRLETERILLLTSYRESAAYAAAYSLVLDEQFNEKDKKALFPTRRQDKERLDLDLKSLADDQILGETPRIILIEIGSPCPFLDSALSLEWNTAATLRDRLEARHSYVILAVDEQLFSNAAPDTRIPYYSVSHLRYLLARDLADRAADDLESRLLASFGRDKSAMDAHELYQLVADRLGKGVQAFESLLLDLELPPAARKEKLQPVTAADVFREDSEIHRAAAFVATYFPDLSQRDFDGLVLTLLGDQTTTVERSSQVVGQDGELITVRENKEERWSERWAVNGDRVFRDCHLRTVGSADGSWIVDFSEPYLRRELRAHLERHFSWYLRRQCQILQDRGILFSLELSALAVDALIRLFVERAVVDPVGFGSVWLLDLVRGLRIQLDGDPPSDSEAELAWLLEQLAVEAQLRAHFYGRLALLIREMLDRETLRPMVREFFEFLIAARQHDVLLDVVLELARRLRFAPHFDPLTWMRRLLDQGRAKVASRAAERLITLARDSGPRIYEFLAVIRSWLPDAARPAERFSVSNEVALEFPFVYSLDVAGSLPEERFGEWPSRHPLFYALPAEPAEAHKEIATLIDWILDPRGSALETGDPSDPTRTSEAVRIAYVGDLVEHWSWVLEGAASGGSPEGRALFGVMAEEIDRRLGARGRSWLQRSWQRRQDDYYSRASNAEGSERTLLVRRRARLDQLRRSFAELATRRQTPGPMPENAGGMAS
jgi:hypothetical protein